MFDPSRVPEGKATMHAWDYVPFDRADGKDWDDSKHDYVERMLTHMETFIENIGGGTMPWTASVQATARMPPSVS